MFRYLSLVFALPCLISCGLVVSSSSPTVDKVDSTGRGEQDHYDGHWKSASKFIAGCVDRREFAGMIDCLGVKTIAAIDRAARTNSINLIPGISLVADRQILQERTARTMMTEEDIENSISTRPDDKGSKLIDMLLDSIAKFLESHSLQFRLPKATSIEMQRALDEGRSKLKKKLLPYLGIFAVKIFALLPVVLGIVGFFALKALFVGKIALIVAAILALQKYTAGVGFGSFGKQQAPPDIYGASGNSFSPVANNPGGYYRRSVEDKGAAHGLAYSAYSPHDVSSS